MRLLLAVIYCTAVVSGKIFSPVCVVPLEYECDTFTCCQPAYLNVTANRLSCLMGSVLAVDSNNFASELASIQCSPSGTFTFTNAYDVERTVAKVTCTL